MGKAEIEAKSIGATDLLSPSSEFCLLEFPLETPGSAVHRESCAAECLRGMLVYQQSTERILFSTL